MAAQQHRKGRGRVLRRDLGKRLRLSSVKILGSHRDLEVSGVKRDSEEFIWGGGVSRLLVDRA